MVLTANVIPVASAMIATFTRNRWSVLVSCKARQAAAAAAANVFLSNGSS